MANNTQAAASSGFLPALLGTAFIVLKLCHVINWSWLWVLIHSKTKARQ